MSVSPTATSLGTNVRVCSWIWVTAWTMAMMQPNHEGDAQEGPGQQ